MNDILSDLNPSKYKLKSNNNQSGSIQNNTTNEQKGDLLADLNSGKYKLKGSEPKEITQTEVQKGIEQLNSPIGILGTVRRTTETKLPEIISEKKLEREEQERWDSLSVPEKIVDPFKTMGANIKYGDLGIEENQAWAEYRSKQDAESLAKAQAATKAREDYEASNDRIGKGNAFTKDFAQYLPQLGGQLASGLGGATIGAVGGAGTALAIGQLGPQVGLPEEIITVPAGAILGGKGGYVAGTAKYSYDVMAGSAYKTLLDMGVPNEVALELSGDEALINSLIEGAGSVVDLISLGIGKLGTKGATTAAKKVAQNRLLAAAKAYGMNLVSEPLEEGAQQLVSIGTQKKAAEQSGIERNVTEAEDRQSILDSMRSGLNVAAITGLGNVAGNVVNNKISQNAQQSKQNREEIRNSLVGLENMLPNYENISESASAEKNVASELPTNELQQPMQQTNQTEGKTAQNGNIAQMVKNIENNNILEYNNNRGVENGEKINGERYTSEVRDGLHEESTQENRQYNTTEYEQWEQSLKPIPRERLTTEEIADIDNTQKEYGKTVNLIDENENSNKYSGGASLTKKGQLNISRQQAEYFGLKNMIEHEVVEDDILYDDVANDILTPAIELIMKDAKFDDQKKAFWKGQTDNIPTDELIAKDILCDRFAEIKNNTKMKYDNILSPDVNTTVDMALQNYYKQVYGKELNIKNDAADTQSAFSMPKTDNQGRKLSAEQQEFFKDSKVRDEEGRLKAVYHGTAEDFTIFDEMFAKEGDYGVGFYFSDVKGVAEESAEGKMIDKDIARYASGDKGKVMETYLNMKKPSVWYNYRDIYKYNKMAKEAGLSFYDYMRKNYDGIIVTNPRYENEGFSESKYYIVFNSNQIKNVDNTKPTSNPDIRYFASSESSRPYMDLDRYTSRDNKSKANKVGLTDIQNAINDIVTVKTGKFRQNAYGIYKTHGEIIRLKQMKDIPVALHELTHHLDKKYNLSSSDKAFNELKKIAVVGENATNQTIISEGVAEFGRYYMTDKEYAKEIAPSYYDAFEKALDGDPTMKAKVENIRQMVTNYLDQSPLNRLSSNIDYGDEDVSLWQKGKDAIIKTANTFRKNFVDDLDPLKKIVKEISGDKKLMTEEDAYKLLRLNNGVTGKVQVALEYGVLDKKGEKVSKSLKEILEPVANNQKEFVAYLTALRANDLQSRGIESGMLSRDVNDVIKMYKENETFNNAAKELYNFQNKILETTLIDSGIITKDALDAYNKNNPHYVPFYRVMDENFKQSKSSKSKKPMKIKGSTRDIINPLESIIKNTYSYLQMAERNDTFKVLFDMANKYDGTGKWFDKVPTDKTMKMSVDELKDILEKLNLNSEEVNYNEVLTSLFKPSNYQKGNIVTVMRRGKPVHYEIMDKELFDILSPTIKGENFIVKLLSPASKALRVGATHTPEFVVRNPLRDTVDAAIYSKNKFRPVVDSLIGMFNVAGRTDLYYKWLQSGGSGSTYTNAQRPVLQKTLKGLTKGVTQEKGVKKALKGVGNLVKHPLKTYLDVAGSISNVAEEGTRVGEFRRALQQGKTEKEAALDSREITLDFSRGGKHAKDINKVVAFFNAELQGLDKMLTSFKDRPVATFVKSLAYVALPAMILRALQDEEELDKVPQWEKDEFFVFFVNGTPIKIPKSQGVGQIFGTFPERAIDYLRTHDKDAFDGLAQRLVTSYVPIDSTTSIFPNFFLPLIENTANYSFFKQQPIVNQSLQNRSPRYQYDENTSTLAKTIGGVLNYSPKKIDNIISGYAGNLGKDAANLIGMPIDLLSGNKKDNEYKSLNSKLKKVPLLKGFIASDYASKSLDKFYKSKDEVSTKYTDAKFNVSDGQTTATEKSELKYYKELNSLYNKAYNEIKELDEQIDAVTNGKGNDKYKETKIEQLKDKKDIIADKVEKQKELKGFNVKFNK